MPQCPIGTFSYVVRPGDTLWLLAQRYNVSVNEIVSSNPGINANKLMVGQVICIRLDPKISKVELDLSNEMRKLWEEHVAWTRMTIISIANNLPDQELVIQRLLRNAPEMGAVFKPYYGNEKASKYAGLIKDHLVIAVQLVKAAKAGNSAAAAEAEKKWYANADEIAAFLGSINPYWSKEDWIAMLHEHLSLTKSEAVSILTGNYATSIQLYDKIENQALMMADGLTNGIVKQFPDKFTI